MLETMQRIWIFHTHWWKHTATLGIGITKKGNKRMFSVAMGQFYCGDSYVNIHMIKLYRTT